MSGFAPIPPEAVLPLLPSHHQAGHMAFVHSIINGSLPGEIVGDDATAPRSAIACNANGFWHTLGEPVAAALDWLGARRTQPFAEPTSLWTTTPAWAELLRPAFEGSAWRIEFHARADLPAVPPLPPGFVLAPLDADIAARFFEGTGPEDGVDPWVVRTFGGPERFAEQSFGFAVLAGSRVAAFCCACAIGGHAGAVEAEIEVGTDARYRQQGLATIAAAAFLAETRRRGLIPGWTCAADNAASERLARRLGFVPFRRIEGFVLG